MTCLAASNVAAIRAVKETLTEDVSAGRRRICAKINCAALGPYAGLSTEGKLNVIVHQKIQSEIPQLNVSL